MALIYLKTPVSGPIQFTVIKFYLALIIEQNDSEALLAQGLSPLPSLLQVYLNLCDSF